ncbi:unnamed protein product, partial [Prunus brigantina]
MAQLIPEIWPSRNILPKVFYLLKYGLASHCNLAEMSYPTNMACLIHYVLNDHKVPPEYMCFSRVPSLPNTRITQ